MLAFGAALGGIFSGIWGIYPAFVLDALTFFVSGIILSRMTYFPPESLDSDKSVGAALRQYVDGLSYLRKHVDIFVIALHKGANSLFVVGAFQVIQVPIAESIYRIGEGGGVSLGLMYALTGVGTGLGPIVVRYFTGDRDRPLRIAIVAGYVISIAGLLLTATLLNFPMVLTGAFLRGVGGGIVWVMSTQLLLQLTEPIVRGRVFSTEFALNTLMNAIAAGSVGALLDTSFTIPSMLIWLSALTVIPTVLWVLWIVYGKSAESTIDEQAAISLES
jgi:predicted MFS family arabinose efflux permease